MINIIYSAVPPLSSSVEYSLMTPIISFQIFEKIKHEFEDVKYHDTDI